jgi:hypothetical protein
MTIMKLKNMLFPIISLNAEMLKVQHKYKPKFDHNFSQLRKGSCQITDLRL